MIPQKRKKKQQRSKPFADLLANAEFPPYHIYGLPNGPWEFIKSGAETHHIPPAMCFKMQKASTFSTIIYSVFMIWFEDCSGNRFDVYCFFFTFEDTFEDRLTKICIYISYIQTTSD